MAKINNHELLLAAIQGKDGKDGVDGVNGKSAYEIWLEQGNTGSKDDFLEWLKGGSGGGGASGKLYKHRITMKDTDNTIFKCEVISTIAEAQHNETDKTNIFKGLAFYLNNAAYSPMVYTKNMTIGFAIFSAYSVNDSYAGGMGLFIGRDSLSGTIATGTFSLTNNMTNFELTDEVIEL